MANNQMNLVGLDFETIKSNLKLFLQSQDTFKDYNFDGSGLSVLLDILSYNTVYNAFYLNQVSSEMFLDTSLQRSSIVSHSKLLNYIPKSAIAPTAYVDIIVDNISDSSLTLPTYTNFLSEAVDGINYNFVTTDSTTVNTDLVNSRATFSNIELKQGIPITYTFNVDSVTNPGYTFELPDSGIDTNTINVIVYKSSTDFSSEIFTFTKDYLFLTGGDAVFFLQESLIGNYEILFGDGIIGKKLTDGNVIKVSYIITQGTSSFGANNFVLMDVVPGFHDVTINGYIKSSQGGEKETLDSIKFQAPKNYSSQNRAVTKEDYISLIQQNDIGMSFDAVNVWGGEVNEYPSYGKIFICVKPTGSYIMTDTQKQKLINDVIKPKSVITVVPTIIDPDYTYIRCIVNVYYDPSKTNLKSSDIQALTKSTINSFGQSMLNNFNSTFLSSEITSAIKSVNPSILSSELSIQLQKRIYPNLMSSNTYKLYYGTELTKGMFISGINSSPSMQFKNPNNLSETIDGVYLEEIPSPTGGVESISISNPGYGYQYAPIVTILGDGTGATAISTINVSGQLKYIKVTSSGNNYTSSIATITPVPSDTSGHSGAAVVNIQGKFGTMRTYYNNTTNVKTILNAKAGTIDYYNGILTLTDFNPCGVSNPSGSLIISVTPKTSIVSSSYNRILTMDQYDPSSVVVSVLAKK